MRYGHQPWSEVAAMPLPIMEALCGEIMTIIELENKSGQSPREA